MRPFRFGIAAVGAPSRSDLSDTLRRAESAGFDVFACADHFSDRHAVFPLLAAAAQLTSMRLSPLVIANDYRHPVVTARDSATIDILSDGRFELGIGTGWIREQYHAAGIAYDPPGTRVDRLIEAVQIIKGCWNGEPYTMIGDHYQVRDISCPQPVQRPRPPILLGGTGRRLLTFAGREADIVSIAPFTAGIASLAELTSGMADSGDRMDLQLEWVRQGAGDRFDNLEVSVSIFEIHETEDRYGLAAHLAVDFESTPQNVLGSPHVLVGNTGEMIESLQERRERFGISYFVFPASRLDTVGPIVAALAGT